jgi:hypothetical protein
MTEDQVQKPEMMAPLRQCHAALPGFCPGLLECLHFFNQIQAINAILHYFMVRFKPFRLSGQSIDMGETAKDSDFLRFDSGST